MWNSQTYMMTIHKERAGDDDGATGGISPPVERDNAGSGFVTMQRAALVGIGLYAGQQIYSAVTSNIRSLTGSSRLQEQVNRGAFIAGSVAMAVKTKGMSLVFQGISQGVQYGIRVKTTNIENEIREQDRKLYGERITNNIGRSAYYD